MEKAKVYFTDFRTKPNVSQGVKLQKLCRQAGLGRIDFEGKFVAIKLHFGELGNFAYIRPNYVKAVADLQHALSRIPEERCGPSAERRYQRLQLYDHRLP